ncbi:iron-sulfur cluster insertion protein ErpA [Blochmannia endosymbiont of Polyrhachis (Hedomyrma) turneri]|uniref:iron-sulfur cluster insertion protein ErpA n=1 Tax=Blochmannia endosymbiont of Polyrhachis (Hedomyrma) turneri TaxID=1505596 RepID=UPI00061A5AF5|nr:iron-sulfur cluster insertion protein ErpA [Blochmannia endosymbiont of Polyrhachis (Hedomyrma) turneri]AKC59739.1 iron-sulfur cluster insertion protein erpA [Blochmannia endosymbiont of Polyrhachis (Hedomyrma) turneri]
MVTGSSKEYLEFTDAAVIKMTNIIQDAHNPALKLRVYIVGGGCGGFQYKFILDEVIQVDDFYIEKKGVILVVDPISLQYLTGGTIDYYHGLEGSRFIVINPNAKSTCSCGLSFSV